MKHGFMPRTFKMPSLAAAIAAHVSGMMHPDHPVKRAASFRSRRIYERVNHGHQPHQGKKECAKRKGSQYPEFLRLEAVKIAAGKWVAS